jgi:hypothetical protein
MKTCITCGMPLEGDQAGEIGLELPEGSACIHCVENGTLKKPEDIFEGGVQFFLSLMGDDDRGLAERITRKNMSSLDYWKAHPFASLEGPMVTDEEFAVAMSRL